MTQRIPTPIAIIIILVCAVSTGVIAWQYQLIPGIGPSVPSLTPTEEIPPVGLGPEAETVAKEQSCINSGGIVEAAMCCKSVGDFPNTCLIGACGCSSENSHEVKICDCGEGCFDGVKCTFEEDETADWKTYRNEEYWFEIKYPEEWSVEEYEGVPYFFVRFRYREGCSFNTDIIPETHPDYDEVSTLRERGEKEENIIVGDTNGVYFDSIHVCSPPVCPETLVRTIYIYKENNLFRITRYATKDNHELECINIFDQILSTFRFID